MTPQEILKFAASHPHCFLATVDGDQPRVRGIHLYRIDQRGLIFHTGAPKPLYRQLCRNQKVEICFVGYEPLIQVRVWGEVEESFDIALKEEIVAEREFLKPLVAQGGMDGLAVFVMKEGHATTWSMDDIMNPTAPELLFAA